MIRRVKLCDAESICDIYNHYVINSTITFEETVISVDDMRARIISITEELPYLVYVEDGEVLGYAYATKWKARSAYRYSVETTVYLHSKAMGKGIGKSLYTDLIKVLKELNIHRVIGGIALPNPASIALHESLGFKKVANFSEVGYKFDKWIDVGSWQYDL